MSTESVCTVKWLRSKIPAKIRKQYKSSDIAKMKKAELINILKKHDNKYEVCSYTVRQLREKLKKYNLSTNGKKAELIKRLWAHKKKTKKKVRRKNRTKPSYKRLTGQGGIANIKVMGWEELKEKAKELGIKVNTGSSRELRELIEKKHPGKGWSKIKARKSNVLKPKKKKSDRNPLDVVFEYVGSRRDNKLISQRRKRILRSRRLGNVEELVYMYEMMKWFVENKYKFTEENIYKYDPIKMMNTNKNIDLDEQFKGMTSEERKKHSEWKKRFIKYYLKLAEGETDENKFNKLIIEDLNRKKILAAGPEFLDINQNDKAKNTGWQASWFYYLQYTKTELMNIWNYYGYASEYPDDDAKKLFTRPFKDENKQIREEKLYEILWPHEYDMIMSSL